MEYVERQSLLKTLYVTIFLTATGLGTTTFLIPVYAETLGASYTDLGIIGASGNIIYTALTLVCGYMLDRYEKVNLYLLFNLIGGCTMIFFAFTTNVSQVLLVRGLLGLAAATFWVSASTLTAEISPREELTQSLGRYNLAWVIGFTVGPYLGGLISTQYGFKIFFLSQGLLILTSIFLISFKIRNHIKLHNSKKSKETSIRALNPLILPYLTLVPFTLVLGVYMAIIPGHMKVVGLTASMIGLLFSITNGVRGVFFFNVAKFVKWSTWKAIALASICIGISMGLVRGGSDPLSFGIPLVLYGAGSGIMTPVLLDFISKRTPNQLRGTAMGVHESIYGFGMCIGPLIGGGIADIYSPYTLYTILVIVSMIILPLGYLMTRNPKA